MEKKEVVINTARELFTKYGYKKVSMDEIARTSNVTKKTIYSYFKDKDELFRYFIEEELINMKQKIEKKINNESFTDKVSTIMLEILNLRKNSALLESIIKDCNTSSNNSMQNMSFSNYYDSEIINYLETKINEEIDQKNIKKCNAHLTAFIIYKVCLSILFEYDEPIDEKTITKEITTILKDGLFN